MDIITYALSKKIAAHALSGVQSMSVSGQILTINTKDSGVLTMTFPTPKDGVSVTDIDVNANNQIVFTMSDGSEIISGKIPTIKGDKGDAGFSPTITENVDNTDKIYKLDITTADSTFTTPNLKGADGTGGEGASIWSEISEKPFETLSTDFSVENGELKVVGGTGEENTIESISVNGTPIAPDENKNVDITVPSIEGLTKDADLATVAKSGDYEDLANKPEIPSVEGLAKITDIPSKVSELENDSNYLSSIPEEYVTDTELESKGYLTEHQDISGKVDKVEGKSLISDTEIARLATVDNYDDTDIKAEIAKKADTTAIPSKVSELTNDSNYQTAEQVNSTVTTEIAKVVADAPEDLNTLKEMSDWIAGHEDDASAMNSAISDNKTSITALQTGKADKSEIPTTVAELADSGDYAKTADVNASISTLQTDKANISDLTAHTGDSVIHVTAENKTLWNTVSNKVNKEDGKALLADTDKTNYDDAVTKAHTHENEEVLDGITSDKVTYWDNKSEFSGSYNDLNDKPTIDAELSNTSENAIQNKVVTKEINKLYSDISFADHDTATSGTSFTDAEDGNMLVTDWTRNLLNPTLETTTRDGVTCTNNGDGTYTLNGRCNLESGRTGFLLLNDNRNTKYIKDVKYVGNTKDSYEERTAYLTVDIWKDNTWVNGSDVMDEHGVSINDIIGNVEFDSIQYTIHVDAGKTCDNVLIKPMLTTDLSATYDDFVSYGGYEIKSCGKNLLNPTLGTTAMNGVTCTANGDGTYTLNGTPTGEQYFKVCEVNLVAGKKYKLVGCPTGGDYNGFSIYIHMQSGVIFDIGYTSLFTAEDSKSHEVIIRNADTEKVFSNLLFKPMLVDADLYPSATYDDFEPYQGETITVTNTTESPAFGLKSHKGITHIISPGNVKCVYPTNESGKGVLDAMYNKDKMLTEQKESLTKKLDVFEDENSVETFEIPTPRNYGTVIVLTAYDIFSLIYESNGTVKHQKITSFYENKSISSASFSNTDRKITITFNNQMWSGIKAIFQ